MMIKIKNEELIKELIGEKADFPKYTTQLINIANQNAQGTRSRVVGQLSELIKECPAKNYEGWKKPITYKTKNALREEIKTKIIFYNKTKSGLEIDADEILRQ